MVALLVGLSIMALLMTAVMPTWRQIAQREKEAELVFRGEQYARAITLYQKKMGPGAMPASLDALVEQKFLRKLYKDPVTGEDFDVVRQVGGNQPGPSAQGRGAAPPTGSAGFGTSTTSMPGASGTFGPIVGVASKSKATSIRIYNGRTHYNEWQFVSVVQTQTPGAVGGGGGVGGRGQGGAPPGVGGAGVGGGRGGGRGGGGRGGGPQGNPGGRGFGGSGAPGPGGSPFGTGNAPQAPPAGAGGPRGGAPSGPTPPD
jgi:type II secretory pathway pseudopilin PulG